MRPNLVPIQHFDMHASTSKRRQEILSLLRIPFETTAHRYEEDNSLPLSPKELVKKLAFEKANSLTKVYPNSIIIGSDTLVELNGRILPKPKTKRPSQSARSSVAIGLQCALVCFLYQHQRHEGAENQAKARRKPNREVSWIDAIHRFRLLGHVPSPDMSPLPNRHVASSLRQRDSRGRSPIR